MANTGSDGLIASTMPDFPLTIAMLFRHGQRVHGRSQVLSFDGEKTSSATFAEVAVRAERLAAALAGLGVRPGDRVATLMWNSQEHLEAYMAVPCMGAVLHTLNLRLAPGDLARIMMEAEDKVVLAHASLLPLMAAVAGNVPTLEKVLVVNDPGMALPTLGQPGPIEYLGYEAVLEAAEPGPDWPEVDEHAAAAICYTSGTTDLPRGVVYSHRSTFLHALATSTGACFATGAADRVLPLVPMFHVNAWGVPYSAWMLGADMVMPHRWLFGGPPCQLIKLARPTVACGVPTIWASLLEYAAAHPDEVDFSSLRLVTSGGAALPEHMMKEFRDRYGVQMGQGWGMTETSPVCTYTLIGRPGEREGKPLSSGRVLPGVEMRAVTPDGAIAPWDGETVGEIEVRGPWVTSSYFGADEERQVKQFHDGWLRTGDLGTLDQDGYLTLSDRLKDVIKSGGEWISSLRLENELVAHPAVLEAAVVGVPDVRWGERPMAFVVLRQGVGATKEELAQHVEAHLPRWWVPDHWAFIDEIPKTTVGKFDKLALRDRYRAGLRGTTP
jgi:fatty-acyl-CoA synthase